MVALLSSAAVTRAEPGHTAEGIRAGSRNSRREERADVACLLSSLACDHSLL